MWTIGWMGAAFVAGYVVSVFSWNLLRELFVDVETQANTLREKLRELERKIRS